MAESVSVTRQDLEAVYRAQSRQVLATLIRLLGDFDLAEEALHDAFVAASERWPREGAPANTRAWLISAGRFRAIDRLRRKARFAAAQEQILDALHAAAPAIPEVDEALPDDRLSLVFTCCHPAVPADAQVALTLREVCGLTTEEIAHAFLVPPATIAQRIVRAKQKIRDSRIPFEPPEPSELAERLAAVSRVIYLVFNEGYSASSGETILRSDLSGEAIRLTRWLAQLAPEPEAMGLLALMLFHESRRAARMSASGELVLIGEQDRSLWDQGLIREASALLERALSTRRFGAYTIQAAIAGLHAQARSESDTDWAEIVGLYDVLLQTEASPLIALNRAVAVAMRDGPGAGLVLVDELLKNGSLRDYHLAHSARAELCRRLGRHADAVSAYTRALELARQEPERRFLIRRLAEMYGP